DELELVAVNGPNDWFGERALFSDRPRSATVIARTEVELWRLTKEKFDALIEGNPWLILHFTQGIGDRLYETNQQLSKIHSDFTLHRASLLRAQPVERRELLERAAVLRKLEPGVVRSFVGEGDAAAFLVDPGAAGALVQHRNGSAAFPDAVRDFLLARL